MKRAFAILLGAFLLSSCQKEEPIQELPPPPPKPREFSPPVDGRVNSDRLVLWKSADSLVRALDSMWADSMRAAPDQIFQLKARRDLAREVAIREVGLLGWPEYTWILQVASTLPINADAFAASGLGAILPPISAAQP